MTNVPPWPALPMCIYFPCGVCIGFSFLKGAYSLGDGQDLVPRHPSVGGGVHWSSWGVLRGYREMVSEEMLPRIDVGQGSLSSCRAWKETGKHRGLAGHEKGCPERKQARQIITEGCCGELMSSICLETEAGRQRLGDRRPWLVALCQWGRWAAGLGTAAGT